MSRPCSLAGVPGAGVAVLARLGPATARLVRLLHAEGKPRLVPASVRGTKHRADGGVVCPGPFLLPLPLEEVCFEVRPAERSRAGGRAHGVRASGRQGVRASGRHAYGKSILCTARGRARGCWALDPEVLPQSLSPRELFVSPGPGRGRPGWRLV